MSISNNREEVYNLLRNNEVEIYNFLDLAGLSIDMKPDCVVSIYRYYREDPTDAFSSKSELLFSRPADCFGETVFDEKTKKSRVIPFAFTVVLQDGKEIRYSIDNFYEYPKAQKDAINYLLNGYNVCPATTRELHQTIEIKENGVVSRIKQVVKNGVLVDMDATIEGDCEYSYKRLRLSKDEGQTILIADLNDKIDVPTMAEKDAFRNLRAWKKSDEEKQSGRIRRTFYVNNNVGTFGHFSEGNASTQECSFIDFEHREEPDTKTEINRIRYELSGKEGQIDSIKSNEIERFAKEALMYPRNQEIIHYLKQEITRKFGGIAERKIDPLLERFPIYVEINNSHNRKNKGIQKLLEKLRVPACDFPHMYWLNKILSFVDLEAYLDYNSRKILKVIRREKDKQGEKTVVVYESKNPYTFCFDLDDKYVRIREYTYDDCNLLQLAFDNFETVLDLYTSRDNQLFCLAGLVEHEYDLSSRFMIRRGKWDIASVRVSVGFTKYNSRGLTVSRFGNHSYLKLKDCGINQVRCLELEPLRENELESSYTKKVIMSSKEKKEDTIDYSDALALINKALSSRRNQETVDVAAAIINDEFKGFFEFAESEGLPDYKMIVKPNTVDPKTDEIDKFRIPECDISQEDYMRLVKAPIN